MLIAQTHYVLINRLVMPASAFLLLIIIGQHSDLLLGEYALVTTFYYVMQTLPLLGLTPFIMREVSRRPEAAGDFFVTIGLFTVAAGLLVNLGAGATLTFMPYSRTVVESVQVVGYSIFGGILAFLAEVILISLQRARLVAITTVMENMLRLVISIVLLQAGAGVVELMWVVFATRLFSLAVYVYNLAQIQPLARRPDWSILGQVRVVLPVFSVSALLYLIVSRLDYFILSVYSNSETMGYYAIAYRLFEIAMLVVAAVTTSVFPRISRQFANDPKQFLHSTRQLVRGMLALLIPLAIFGYLFAEEYVWLLFSKQYPHPVLLAQLFILILPLAGLDALYASVLNSADLQGRDLRAMMMGAVVYIFALLLLVPPMLGVGAFIALALATFTQFAVRSYQIHRHLGVLLSWRDLAGFLLLAAAMLWLVDSLDRTMGVSGDLLGISALVMVYPAGLILFGLFHPLQMLGDFWRPMQIRPQSALCGLLDHMAEDVRYRRTWLDRGGHRCPAYDNLGLISVVLYRLSRFCQLNGFCRTARVVWQFGLTLTKADISPESDIGPGLVLVRPAGIILSGKVGSHVVFDAWSGLGLRGSVDVGAGPGIPLIEDDVVVTPRSGVLGGMRIRSGTVFAPHCLALRPADLRHGAASGQS